MLMRLSHDLGLYFYDVVVARFDFWAAFGVLAQFVFAARFLVQWIASEKAEQSVIPVGFWFLSIGGGLMTLIYGFARRDLVIILGQAFSIFIYVRNLDADRPGAGSARQADAIRPDSGAGAAGSGGAGLASRAGARSPACEIRLEVVEILEARYGSAGPGRRASTAVAVR